MRKPRQFYIYNFTRLCRKAFVFIIFLLLSISLISQEYVTYYESIDTLNYSAPAETIIKLFGNEIECYTFPKRCNIGEITAQKGKIKYIDKTIIMSIDSSWLWSSNTGFIRKIRIGCTPNFELSFNQDSSKLTLKTPKKEKDVSKYKITFRDYEKGSTYRKVIHPTRDFDWNCGSYKNWKKGLNENKIRNCNK